MQIILLFFGIAVLVCFSLIRELDDYGKEMDRYINHRKQNLTEGSRLIIYDIKHSGHQDEDRTGEARIVECKDAFFKIHYDSPDRNRGKELYINYVNIDQYADRIEVYQDYELVTVCGHNK